MNWPWAYLDPQERETFRTLIAFLDKRLAEQATIDWALKLRPGQRIERLAIAELLTGSRMLSLAEPWASAWRLIEESWFAPQSEERSGTAIYGIQQRLRAGDRSGAVVSAIVDLVAPRIKVEKIDAWQSSYLKMPRKPKKVEHLLSVGITSGDLVDLNVLSLSEIDDEAFLVALANALEGAVNKGLDIARRLGWRDGRSFVALGLLNRVYYVNQAGEKDAANDVDKFHQGIAPSVKLFYVVVSKIVELNIAIGKSIVSRLLLAGSPIHLRLWAALSRDHKITAASEVSTFLLALSTEQFWDIHRLPEFAELRTVRFNDLSASVQNALLTRIRKGPPRGNWPKQSEPDKVERARLYWSVRELKRLELGGGNIPKPIGTWMSKKILMFDELSEMEIDDGYGEIVTVTRRREARPDAKFDVLSGVERLSALEIALGTGRRGWDDDPAERANDWINQQGNAEKVLSDFEAANDGGNAFPKVWNRFGWLRRPPHHEEQALEDAELTAEAGRVLSLLNNISDPTLSNAIEGVCTWLNAWAKHAVKLPLALPIWLRLWPIAVEVTDRKPEDAGEADLSVVARVTDDDREPMDLDTLNTPAGKLVGVFLAACPSLPPEAQGFSADSMERQMRDIVIAAEGRSGLIVKHRMIESLPYFLRADPDWAHAHLIAPLYKEDFAALALWRAVARRTRFTDVLKSIGAAMSERAKDRRLGRQTRRSLVFSLVIESLHAFREGRAPAVLNQRIQQMLRTLEDELRASAANAIKVFVQDLSLNPPQDQFTNTPDGLFQIAAAPFLREVWPQERSLATPGVSGALADLPAASGEAFAEAVNTIARFLVPFDCWSMIEYGLYSSERDRKKIELINDEAKAGALLTLLDLTIGTSDGSVVPYDLTDALDQIQIVKPALVATPIFRRLAAAARR